MRKKIISLVVLFVLTFNALGVVLVTTSNINNDLPEYQAFDVGPRLRGSNPKTNFGDFESSKVSGGSGSSVASSYGVGDQVWGIWYDDISGNWLVPYTVRAIGTVAEVWVMNDLSWANPLDPRPTPVIPDEQVNYLLGEFENNIYPTDVNYFGEPNFHDGSNALLGAWGYGDYFDESGRSIIMVSNIGDENYYDPNYPSYIAGFYWGQFEAWFDRNIISIDTWDWDNRVGPDGSRPYLYEGTIAHELQHLIHSDLIPGNELFINEGFSDYAGMLCGYGAPWGHINTYLATPDNSLTEWGDQGGINILADYGAAALFAIYLNDHFGANFISDFMATGIPGFDGLNYALFPTTFDEVYHNWRIANLIHSDKPGHGIYNYKSIDLADGDPARVYDVTPAETPIMGSEFGTTITGYGNDGLGFDTGISLLSSYGSDYIRLTDFSKEDKKAQFLFDGDDSVLIERPDWLRVDEGYDGDADNEWYSTMAGELADMSIIAEYTLPDAPVTLSFDTYIDIENDADTGEGWDYGFVQVSADGGNTWTSLANEYTTTPAHPNAHPDIVSQLPGITGWYGYVWLSMDFDLTAYAGQTVSLRFRYMTDWNTQWEGWYVDNIAINALVIDDADTVVLFMPVENDLFLDTDFIVTLISVEMKHNTPKYKHIKTIKMSKKGTETAKEKLDKYIKKHKHNGDILLIVSATVGPVDYEFSVTGKHKKH